MSGIIRSGVTLESCSKMKINTGVLLDFAFASCVSSAGMDEPQCVQPFQRNCSCNSGDAHGLRGLFLIEVFESLLWCVNSNRHY